MEQELVLRDAGVQYAGVHILGNPFCIDGAYHYFIPRFMAHLLDHPKPHNIYLQTERTLHATLV